MLKNWLTIGSVAFSIGSICALPFNGNLAQSALIGFATIPGALASTVVRSRQRRIHINRQISCGKLRLNKLRKQGDILNHKLQISEQNRQSIEIQVQQLNNLAVGLQERIDLHHQHHSHLEEQSISLTLHYQEQQDTLAKLELKILEKQACLQEFNGQLFEVRSQLKSTESKLNQKQTRLEHLDSQLAIKAETIANSEKTLRSIQSETIDRQSESANLTFSFNDKANQSNVMNIQQNRDFKYSKNTNNSDNLIVDRDWHHNFIDNPHLAILQHIEKHGAIAEAEASNKLGNPRSVRQFANKLEEYTQYLPFTIRVEPSPQGNRYLKESQR
jgi:chromosome segregation ATPase